MKGQQIDSLVQEKRNSSVLAMELRLSCTNPSKYSFISSSLKNSNSSFFSYFSLCESSPVSTILMSIELRGKYRKISNISCTKSPNLNDSCLVLQLPFLNSLMPGVKLRMKMSERSTVLLPTKVSYIRGLTIIILQFPHEGPIQHVTLAAITVTNILVPYF